MQPSRFHFTASARDAAQTRSVNRQVNAAVHATIEGARRIESERTSDNKEKASVEKEK